MIIDGSQGEGGGQMIRSALGLALVTGKPFRIENIRAKRRQPGLRKQHLTAVLAAKRVGNARVEGAELGSSELTFQPKKIVAGQHSFRVGTAGSASLVLQTVLPALMLADAPSSLVLEGGTHNAWAPPFDYLREVYVPLVERMGPTIEMKLIRHGFYPVGGGKFTVEVTPTKKLQGYDILERGEQRYRSVRAIVSRLPLTIADRECDEIAQRLDWDRKSMLSEEALDPQGPGNVVMIEMGYQNVSELVTGFGKRGTSAEKVAADAADQMSAYLESEAPVGEHLADQWMLPLAISAHQGSGGRFRTCELSGHSQTHIELLQRFLNIKIKFKQHNQGCEVSIS